MDAPAAVVLVGIAAHRDDADVVANLLRRVPPGLGVSYAIVGGLDAAALLGRLPQLAVTVLEVRDRVQLEPDRVYLVPPASQIRLREATLSTQREARRRSPSTQADELFSQLARARRGRAIGLVLAAAELQPRRGAETIARCGGLTMALARDPADASPPAPFDRYLPLDRLADDLVAQVTHAHGRFTQARVPQARVPAATSSPEPVVDEARERLERELDATRHAMNSLIQELEAANEELESANEELLSMNEDLQSANTAVEDSERRLHGIIDSMFAFVGLLDRDGTLREANRAPLEAADLTRSEVIGRPFWECSWWTHDPAVQDRLRAAFARAVGGEIVRYDEAIRVRNDGRMVIDFMLQPVIIDGEVRFVIPSAVDVTARVAAEMETRRLARDLARRVEETETLLRVMPMGIGIAHDPACKRITANPVFASLLGISPDVNASLTAPEAERPGTFRVFAAGREVADDMLPLQVAAREGIAVSRLELEIVHVDGRVVHLLEDAAPLLAEDGSPRGAVGAFVDITEHKRAEIELRYQLDLTRSITDNATTAIFMVDAHGRCTFANPAAEAMTGISRDELVGRILHDLIHHTRPDGTRSPSSECPIEQALPDRTEIRDHEDVFVRRDGRFYFVVCNARVIHRGGEAIGTVIEVRDVSEERAAEARFQTLAESIPQLAWMADRAGDIFWFNRRWYEYTGTTPEQVRSWGWQAAHDPEVLPAVLERWKQSLATGEPFDMVFPLRGADGRFRPFLTRVLPLRDELGQIRLWFGTNTDISEQRAITLALEQRERELRSLADNSPDILARFDREHRHVFVNLEVERATGRRRDDFLGRTTRELGMPPELCDRWDAALRWVFETAQPSTLELVHASPAGVRYYTSRLVPEFDARGMVETVLGVTHDQTDLKLANEALRAADHRKDEFLAMLAHELRNPLAPLRSGIELLRSGAELGTERVYAMMSRQLSHLVRLVDDLLDVSRISRGKLELKLERMELRPAVEAAIESTKPSIEANRHELAVRWSPEPIWVEADATRLAQMVSNLLNNAAKYTPSGGSISLATGRDAERAFIRITDNGFGIPPEQLPHMFSMFMQIAHTKERAQGGLGIGLALVHRLAELHGGTVTVESAGIDRGSTFTLELPVTSDRTVAPQPAVHHAPEVPAGQRVLIVDDNHDAAEMLTALLEHRGFAAQFVTTGEAGLDVAPLFQPHVILLDIGLPDLSGYEVARKLREVPSLRDVKIIALTGWGTAQDKERSRAAGFDAHLTKPVSLDALFKALSS